MSSGRFGAWLQALTKKQKIIAAALVAALVVATTGGIVGVNVYNANTREMIENASTSYATAYGELSDAHTAGTAAIENASTGENTAGYLTADDAEGSDPTDGDALVDTLNAALEATPLPGDATVSPSTREEAKAVQATVAKLQEGTKEITNATQALNDSVTAYQTQQLIAAAQKALSDATASRDEAVKAAEAAINTAKDGADYRDGFADSDEGKALIADVQAKLDAAKAVDTDGTAETREDVDTVNAKVQPVQDATTALTEATKTLTDKTNAYASAKKEAAEQAAAAAAAAAQSKSNSTSSGSSSYSSGSSSSASSGSGSSSSGSSSSNSGSSNTGSSSSGSGSSGSSSTCTEGRTVYVYIGDKTLTNQCQGGQWVTISVESAG